MLEKINQIFGDIKDAIVEKGVEVDDCASPDTYADRIMEIETCSNETCDDGGSEGSSTSGPKASYFFLPAYKRSSTKPTRPTWTAPFTANENNEIRNTSNNINLPSGWYTIDYCIQAQANSQEMLPLWVSYCAVRIYNSVVSSDMYYGTSKWTEPICLGYPYANTSGSWVGDGDTSIVNNGGKSKTFVIFTSVSSSNITVYRPTGGTWDTSTNNLTGNITSDTSDGNTVYWYTSKGSASGSYTWVSIGTFGPDGKILGTWSDPFCINARDGKDGANGQNGQNGRDGVDGTNVEFIYKRCADMEAFRALTAPESDHYTNKQIPSGWTANPSGIDCDSYKIEAECSRTLESNGLWSDWSAPAIHSICGDGAGDGKDGRSITSVDYWFKVSASGSGITAPSLDVVDPTTEGWSKQAGSVSAQYPYLWCFTQTNFTTNLTTGYPYSRSDAYIVRRFNTDTSGEFSDLQALIESTRQNLQDQIDKFDIDFSDLDEYLDGVKSDIENDMSDSLTDLNDRLNQVENGELDSDKLWSKLIGYTEPGVKNSFSGIVIDAENAKNTLTAGSEFFGHRASVDVTLNGLRGEINQKATKSDIQDLDTRIKNVALEGNLTVTAELINGIVSKGQVIWTLRNESFAYDKNWDKFFNWYQAKHQSDTTVDTTGIFRHFENWMQGKSGAEGPSWTGSSANSSYPEECQPQTGETEPVFYKLETIVNEFSEFKQTSDSIKSSVEKWNYQWTKDGILYDYDAFKKQWENESSPYNSWEYPDYVESHLNYEKIETGKAISNISQTADNIRTQVGTTHYYWKRESNGTVEYQPYNIPDNYTQSQYETNQRNAGWTRMDWNDNLAVFDITPESITSTVKKASLAWVKYDSNNNITDTKSYDYWIADYEQASTDLNYDNWVAQTKQYQKEEVKDSWSAIKQTADRVTSMVSDIDGNSSMIDQLRDEIALAVEGDSKYWVVDEAYTPTGYEDEIEAGNHAYKEWWSMYLGTLSDQTTANSKDYETWVLGTLSQDHITLEKDGYSLGAIDLTNNQVLIGLSGHNGNYYGAITLQKEPNTKNAKIILDAANTVVNGNLSAGIVNAALANLENLNVTSKATINQIVASSVTAGRLESIDSGRTRRVLIEDGKAEFSLWDATMNDGQGGWRKRIDIGIEGTTGSNQSLVLRFFDTDGTALYNLGPAGLMKTAIAKYVITDQYGTWEYN